jgi:hypothetical protein
LVVGERYLSKNMEGILVKIKVGIIGGENKG